MIKKDEIRLEQEQEQEQEQKQKEIEKLFDLEYREDEKISIEKLFGLTK